MIQEVDDLLQESRETVEGIEYVHCDGELGSVSGMAKQRRPVFVTWSLAQV